MKILLFEWRDIKNPLSGGSEIYFHELAKTWIKKGHSVTIICSGWKDCKKEEEVDKIKIIRVGRPLSLYIKAPLAYFKLKEKPDIIIDVENGIPFFTPLFSRTKKILHIHHVHKDVWFKEMKFPFSFIGWMIETKLMPLVYRKNKVITLSNSSAEEINKGKIGKVVGIVNPGIEFYKYKKYKKNKTPAILFLNRIKKYKGLKILLDAIKDLDNRGIKEIEVWVAGSGDELENMKEYAKNLGLKNVIFYGRVDEEKKKELMQKAWIFVNPSFIEGWGIVNIEANYFHTPVIGSDVGGIKDSIIDGKTGFLFKYGESKNLSKKIEKIIKDNNLRKKLEKESYNWAKQFDWETKGEEYLKILDRVKKNE
ncbi:MAG: glycosyltransferase family 4 protein [Candidatus Pacearchaeota archaeon]|jgi:glycosyltransferase involved in cell wall biosynthesis